jgi:hypothetical protein
MTYPTFNTVPLGSQYYTGQKAPISGVYSFVRHMDGTFPYFCATSGASQIPLAKGETFPPHGGCGKSAYWRLDQYA